MPSALCVTKIPADFFSGGGFDGALAGWQAERLADFQHDRPRDARQRAEPVGTVKTDRHDPKKIPPAVSAASPFVLRSSASPRPFPPPRREPRVEFARRLERSQRSPAGMRNDEVAKFHRRLFRILRRQPDAASPSVGGSRSSSNRVRPARASASGAGWRRANILRDELSGEFFHLLRRERQFDFQKIRAARQPFQMLREAEQPCRRRRASFQTGRRPAESRGRSRERPPALPAQIVR